MEIGYGGEGIPLSKLLKISLLSLLLSIVIRSCGSSSTGRASTSRWPRKWTLITAVTISPR